MSIGCTDCGKTNLDEELLRVKSLAKAAAIDNNEAQAVYSDGGEYKYISAYYASNNGYNIITILSAYC